MSNNTGGGGGGGGGWGGGGGGGVARYADGEPELGAAAAKGALMRLGEKHGSRTWLPSVAARHTECPQGGTARCARKAPEAVADTRVAAKRT